LKALHTLLGGPQMDLHVRAWNAERLGATDLWAEFFEHWSAQQRRYYRATTEVGWWWQERTCVGQLAAAAWATGGTALEEYRHVKHRGTGKETYVGRADLFLQLGGRSLALEAKHKYLSPRSRVAAYAKLARTALADGKKTFNWSDQFIGVAFAGIYRSGSNDAETASSVRDEVRRLRDRDWDSISEVGTSGLLVHYFPSWVPLNETYSEDCFNPGQVMVLAFK
jgi:hypothetical protein